MRNTVNIACPLCGTEQSLRLAFKEYELIRCDAEVGGCDKPLIIQQSDYHMHNVTVFSALHDAEISYRQVEINAESHNILQFGAFLVEKSIEAFKAGHYFGYQFHPILREFDIEIYLGGWKSDKEADFNQRDLRASNIENLQAAKNQIEAILQIP